MRALKRFVEYSQVFGSRGPALAARAKLAPSSTRVSVYPPGARHPFHVRITDSDVNTYRKIFIGHEYDLALGRDPQVIIDAGANIGVASVYFALKYPKARLFAIEPEPANFELLQENVSGYPNITAIHAALWQESGQIDLVDPGIGAWGFQVGSDTSPNGRRIGTTRAISVDEILGTHQLKRVDILKIDIEGAEKEVFRNASAWIDKVGVIMIELHDRFKAGCSRSFYVATRDFDQEILRGENVFMVRNQYLAGEGAKDSVRVH